MASQVTTTMDSSFGGYDDFLQMEGQMATQVSMKLGLDVKTLFDFDVHTAAPGLMNAPFPFETACSTTAAKFDSVSDEPLSSLADITFVDGGEFSLESLLSGQAVLPETVQPSIPEHKEDTSWLTASSDISALINVGGPKDSSSSPGSPDSGIESVDAGSSLDEILSQGSISSPESCCDNAFVACSTPVSPEQSFELVASGEFISVSEEDLSVLQSLWEDDHPANEISGTHAVLSASEPVALPAKPISPLKSSKSTKSLSSREKKERKRAQNKNAATRYREKKREEARAIFEEQTKLEEINKSLKDKVTLISREMEYMKELLIEVYRAKGLIE